MFHKNGNGNGNGNQENGGETLVVSTHPRKFLFISWEGLGGDLAWHIKKEGNEVKIYIKEQYGNDVYDGFLEKIDDWKQYIDWADIIVFDDTGFGYQADSLRKAGKLVIGGSSYTDRIEEDREFGQLEITKVGMLTIPHWEFGNFDAAIEFIKTNPGRYVWKSSGGATPYALEDMVFLGREEDGRDIIEVLEHNKTAWAKKIKKFQLQKFVAGVEVAVGVYFNGEDFMYPINVNFEHKKLFPGNLGPYTGEMGSLTYWCAPNRIFTLTLAKMKDKLKEAGYAGFFYINCIANSRGVYPLEFTSRFVYPNISIQIEGALIDWGGFLYSLAQKQPFDLRVKRGFQVGAVIAVPPFPYIEKTEFEIYRDLSLIFKKQNLDGFHIGDLKFVDGDWRLAGESGYVMVVTGSGTTAEEARRQMYNRIQNVMLQNMFYRTDIGSRWSVESDKLQTWGYLS